MKDKFKTNKFAKSYKSDLTQEVETFDYKYTELPVPVEFFVKLALVLLVGIIIGSLI